MKPKLSRTIENNCYKRIVEFLQEYISLSNSLQRGAHSREILSREEFCLETNILRGMILAPPPNSYSGRLRTMDGIG